MVQGAEKIFKLVFRGTEDDWEQALTVLGPAVRELESRFGQKLYTEKGDTSGNEDVLMKTDVPVKTDASGKAKAFKKADAGKEAGVAAEVDATMENAVVQLLSERGLTVTCAESCTGGLLSGRIINVPGVSDVYKAGFVTYSDKAKRKLLGVRKNTLKKYGAVSPQTAREMAAGAAKAAKADVALAVTGIAGPGGGTTEKPVGLVYIGCSVKGKITVKKYQFSGSRRKVRESTVAAALTLARKSILKNS